MLFCLKSTFSKIFIHVYFMYFSLYLIFTWRFKRKSNPLILNEFSWDIQDKIHYEQFSILIKIFKRSVSLLPAVLLTGNCIINIFNTLMTTIEECSKTVRDVSIHYVPSSHLETSVITHSLIYVFIYYYVII